MVEMGYTRLCVPGVCDPRREAMRAGNLPLSINFLILIALG